MEQQDNHSDHSLQRPSTNDPGAWRVYWRAQNQAWRTEPEINQERQEELKQRRNIAPDIIKGIYPFKGMRLERADMEWLLATHGAGRGPVDWDNEQDRNRDGLDLCGTDLRQADLSRLPWIYWAWSNWTTPWFI
jgi:hypothetical protein